MPAVVKLTQLPTLHQGQQQVAADTTRFRIVKAGRRWGKTRLGVWECVKVALEGGRAWWVAPSYKLAKPGWRDLRAIARQIPGATINLGEMEVRLPGGGEVAVRTAADPDQLRAESLDFVVLDEYAFMPEEAWREALRPALADRRGGALFISTPKGMLNTLYQLWEQAQANPRWATYSFTTYDNPYIHDDEIEEMRDELGERLFAQEVLGEFLEGVGVVFNANWFTYYTHLTSIDEDGVEREYVSAGGELVQLDECARYITCDPALTTKETSDYTVFAVWARTPLDKLLLLDVVRLRMESTEILDRADELLSLWDAEWVGFESVAFQLTLVQHARKRGMPVEKLAADKDKVARARPAAAAMERASKGRPAGMYLLDGAEYLPVLQKELLLFPDGDHDDQVDAISYGLVAKRKRQWGAA